jgi:hypothetical protein
MISELAFLLKLGNGDIRQVLRANASQTCLKAFETLKRGGKILGKDNLLIVSKAGTKMAMTTIITINVVRMKPSSSPRV